MVDQFSKNEAIARRISSIEKCFGASGQSLAIPGRTLIGEGILTKMCRKKAKSRQFFLFNDILVYGNIVIAYKKYNKQHVIPLEKVTLENLEDDEVLKNGWVIKTPTKSFAVYAVTAIEKTQWMAHIHKYTNDLLEKSGKKSSPEHAAVWIADAEASICMHCRKTQFTVLNRRHHCRKCGNVVCNPCSSKRYVLASQSSKPLRVCLSCYDMLTKARSNLAPVGKSTSQDSDREDSLADGGKSDGLVKGMENLAISKISEFYVYGAEEPANSDYVSIYERCNSFSDHADASASSSSREYVSCDTSFSVYDSVSNTDK